MNRKDKYTALVTSIIADHLGLTEVDVGPDTNIYDELGADSLDSVELMMAFEEEYNIDIKEEDAEQFKTATNVVDYLMKAIPE